MAVGTNQSLTRYAKPFQMNLMTNSVARTGEINAVLLGNTANKTVIVCIFKTALQRIMIDICNTAFGANSWNAHCFKFQVSHGTRCILRQGLVNPDSNFLAFYQFTFHQMCFQNFFCKGQAHVHQSFLCVVFPEQVPKDLFFHIFYCNKSGAVLSRFSQGFFHFKRNLSSCPFFLRFWKSKNGIRLEAASHSFEF